MCARIVQTNCVWNVAWSKMLVVCLWGRLTGVGMSIEMSSISVSHEFEGICSLVVFRRYECLDGQQTSLVGRVPTSVEVWWPSTVGKNEPDAGLTGSHDLR